MCLIGWNKDLRRSEMRSRDHDFGETRVYGGLRCCLEIRVHKPTASLQCSEKGIDLQRSLVDNETVDDEMDIYVIRTTTFSTFLVPRKYIPSHYKV